MPSSNTAGRNCACSVQLCTCTVHLYCASELCTSAVHLYCASVPRNCTVHLYCASVPCICTVRLNCAPLLCICTVHLYHASVSCTCAVHLHCALVDPLSKHKHVALLNRADLHSLRLLAGPSGWSIGTVCDSRAYTIDGTTYSPPDGYMVTTDYKATLPERPGAVYVKDGDQNLPLYLGECAGRHLELQYPGTYRPCHIVTVLTANRLAGWLHAFLRLHSNPESRVAAAKWLTACQLCLLPIG
jgi:hypothetical protein